MPRSSGLVPQLRPQTPALGPWPRRRLPQSAHHPTHTPHPGSSAPTTRPGPASGSQPPPAASSPWDLVPTPAPSSAPGPAQHPQPQSRLYCTFLSGPGLWSPHRDIRPRSSRTGGPPPRPRSGSHPRPPTASQTVITSTPRARPGAPPAPPLAPGPACIPPPVASRARDHLHPQLPARRAPSPHSRPAPNRVPGPDLLPPPLAERKARASGPPPGRRPPGSAGASWAAAAERPRPAASAQPRRQSAAGPDGAVPEGGTGQRVSAPAAAAGRGGGPGRRLPAPIPAPWRPPTAGTRPCACWTSCWPSRRAGAPGSWPRKVRRAAQTRSRRRETGECGGRGACSRPGGGASCRPTPRPLSPACGAVPPCAPCSPPSSHRPQSLPGSLGLAQCPVPAALCHPPPGRP